MTAWHNNPDLKAAVVARMRAHREADEFIQGSYQEIDPEAASGYRGCAIGCTLPLQPESECPCGCGGPDDPRPERRSWHSEVEHLYGIKASVGELIDATFECLPPANCAGFAVDVIAAIPVGADLTEVSKWAEGKYAERGTWDASATAAELIERLRTAPVPAAAA